MHIGSHKAGSTSIQEFCRRHPEQLAAGGVHYPAGAFPRFPAQHSELKDLVQHDRMAEVGGFFAKAVAAAAAQGAETVFLSGEDLCALGPGLAHRLQVAAAAAFSSTTVVLVLRNKRDYLYSSFKHHLLYGRVTGEHDFVARQMFSPRRTVEAWRGLKGVAVQVLSFDAMRKDFLAGFFRAALDLAVESPIRANFSLDYMTLQMLNAMAKRPGEGGVDAALLRLVLQAIARHKAPAPLPVEDVIADNLDRCYANEDWDVPGLDFTAALLARRQMARAGVDTAADASADASADAGRMSDLYSVLQTYLSANHRAA
jgi:hypothetical protein